MGRKDSSREITNARQSKFVIRALIISHIRFFRESLAEVLPRNGTLSVSGIAADLQEALPSITDNRPDVIMLDEALPRGLVVVRQIQAAVPQIPVVVIAVAETAKEVISWAEAGAAGYIPSTAGIADIGPLLVSIMHDSQPCSASVGAGLFRRLSNGGASNGKHPNMTSPLTARELQIAQMIVEGMSNKEIARRLNIGLSTTKTHVHNLLGKLGLERRTQAARWARDYRSAILPSGVRS